MEPLLCLLFIHTDPQANRKTLGNHGHKIDYVREKKKKNCISHYLINILSRDEVSWNEAFFPSTSFQETHVCGGAHANGAIIPTSHSTARPRLSRAWTHATAGLFGKRGSSLSHVPKRNGCFSGLQLYPLSAGGEITRLAPPRTSNLALPAHPISTGNKAKPFRQIWNKHIQTFCLSHLGTANGLSSSRRLKIYAYLHQRPLPLPQYYVRFAPP